MTKYTKYDFNIQDLNHTVQDLKSYLESHDERIDANSKRLTSLEKIVYTNAGVQGVLLAILIYLITQRFFTT